MADEIRIEQLEVQARVGVPDAERAQPQRLQLSITLTPAQDFAALDDDLGQTIDYAAVADEATALAKARAVKLIETLANDIAAHLLRHFPLQKVEVEVRKFMLPETKYVSVRVRRVTGEQ